MLLEDTSSTNGTYVNEEHIGQNGHRELRDGDRVRFGGFSTVVNRRKDVMRRLTRLAAIVYALVWLLAPSRAFAAPQAHILRIDPSAGVANGTPILTTVIEIVQFNRLSVASLPPGRRWTRKQLIPGVRSAAGSLRQAAASPVKLGLLFGGSALITLAYIAGLDASVQAFGGGPGLVALGAVYLAAAALAAAAPTPGGLGAIEAALVAGLTGVGMQPGPAVSAVLLYRLATYWLPVLPGWLCWRSLQHREYV